MDSCLSLRNELSEETNVLIMQETFLGRGAWAESSRVREPRRTVPPHSGESLGFDGDGTSFWVVSDGNTQNSITLIEGPSLWHTHHSAKMDSSKEDSGRLAGHVVSF